MIVTSNDDGDTFGRKPLLSGRRALPSAEEEDSHLIHIERFLGAKLITSITDSS